MKKWILTEEERKALITMAAGKEDPATEYYAKALAQVEEGKLGGWNWASALFGNLWLSYHKAFLLSWLLAVPSTLLSKLMRFCLEGHSSASAVLYSLGEAADPSTGFARQALAGGLVWLIQIVLMGLLGNRLLFWSLRRKLRQGYLNLPNYKMTESGWIWATFWLAFGFSFIGGFLTGFGAHVALPCWLQTVTMQVLQFAMLPSLILVLWKAVIRPIWDNYRVWRLSQQNSEEKK